jgi:PAS domain S-box-containing protein
MGIEHFVSRIQHLPRGPVFLYAAVSIAILVGGYSLYQTEEQHLRNTREKELIAIARLKAERIHEWREKVRADAHTIIDSPFLLEGLAQWMTSEDARVTDRVLVRFRGFQKYYGYQDVLLVDVDGKVRLNLLNTRAPLAGETLKGLDAALKSHAPVLTDLYRLTEDASPQLDVVAPLYSPSEGPKPAFGAVILRVDPSKVLFPMIQTWPTASQTAETLLVRREGDQVLFLNELRHRKGTALRLKIPLSETELPAVQAVMGIKGAFMGKDYRGVKVLSAVDRVNDSPWFIVSKVDTEEALSEWRSRSQMILALISVLLAGAFGVFVFYWQRQSSQHYQALYRAERERLALTQHFEYLVKYANDMILLADQDARIIEANDSAVAAYGYTLDELRELHMSNLVIPEERGRHLESIREFQEEGSALYETVHQRKDGTRFNVEVSTRFIEIEGVPFLQKIIRDITERKQAQEKLEHSERKFRLLFENMTTGFALHKIILDEDGRPVDYEFVEVNPAFEQLTGLKAEDIVGHRVKEVLPVTEPYWIEIYGLTALTGQSQRLEEYSEGLGRYFDVLAYCTQPEYFAVIFTDITERKHSEQAREDLLKNLQEKTEEMESLLYVSSHDLRTPLVNIQGFSQRLEKAARELTGLFESENDGEALRAASWPILRERMPSALGYIVASANKMDSLINGLLRISRLGRVQLNAVNIDMNNLLESVLASQEHQVRQAKATIVVDRLPACWGDPSQINQVFSNLIDNALKYGSGTKLLRVLVHGEIQGDMAIYCVEDTGPGIKLEHQDKVWGLFSRLDPGGGVEGEGLGLTVVKRIAQRHRGRVWLESEQDKGSRFYVALPWKPAPKDSTLRNTDGGLEER